MLELIDLQRPLGHACPRTLRKEGGEAIPILNIIKALSVGVAAKVFVLFPSKP